MERHLLITVSEQQSALCGLRFVGYFSNKKDLRITLYYTAPKPAAVWDDERTFEAQELANQQAKKNKEKGEAALDAAKSLLVDLGFSEDCIETKLDFRMKSKITDIIQEAQSGLYDGVVLGRRGLSWLEELFSESVSKGLLETKVNFPLWFCRKPKPECKDVLVCMDGSDAASRMTDHVGFVMVPEKDHKVTLFIVNKDSEMTDQEIESIQSTAKEHFIENSYPLDSLKFKTVEASNVAKAILAEAIAKDYAAVAVGRTKAKPGFYLGSVSTKLFRELEGPALWICH